ncbi:hypothetical protein CMV_003249 [Castanea mollissima]|uniref:Uncharacterized protein n=1 Tax=Castanea mollissima TaxID=60419 RepID=A0A8J4RHR5_9ROSI|nr:hypothetical protein CMV_003249 [Castanea mollissima]
MLPFFKLLIAFSSPLADFDDLVSSYEAILVRSVSSVVRNKLRSVVFNIRRSDSTKLKSYGSRKMILEGSLSFKGRELETVFSFKTPTAEMENDVFGRCVSSKTRVYEQGDGWQIVEFLWNKAELKRSFISFFDIGKPETAVSRWSRARTRAAKVGKGLCKVGNVTKLALQHWLEAVSLMLKAERKAYEVVVQDGKLVYKQSGEYLHTEGEPKDAKWIFVLSTSKTLYIGLKNKDTFQHSSFLAGGATLSAGRLVVEDGILKAVWPHSGHYRPTEGNFQELMSFLKKHHVDLTNVKATEKAQVKKKKKKPFIKRAATYAFEAIQQNQFYLRILNQ